MNTNLTTFYIIRHGETEWNALKKAQGHADIPLNENGRAQAKNVAKKLRAVHFDLAFSSDLVRAKETAEIIALEHNLTVATTHLLRERHLGEMEGKHFDAFEAYDQLYDSLSAQEKRLLRSDPTAENDEEVIGRLLSFIRQTAFTHPGKTILIGTHGGLIRVLLTHLGFFSSDVPHRAVQIRNGSYVKLESDGVDFFIRETHGIVKNENILSSPFQGEDQGVDRNVGA